MYSMRVVGFPSESRLAEAGRDTRRLYGRSKDGALLSGCWQEGLGSSLPGGGGWAGTLPGSAS